MKYLSASDSLVSIEQKPVIAFVVTDAGDDVSFGDYFTAKELASSMEAYGWESRFVCRLAGGWYFLPEGVTVLVSMLEQFDPGKIRCRGAKPYAIGWARNWFSKWKSYESTNRYDSLWVSSNTAREYLVDYIRIPMAVVPIATNYDCFYQAPGIREYQSDICFTGSFWYQPRELERLIDPLRLKNYRFDVYGSNWDRSDKFRPYWRGFVPYSSLKEVYQTVKIVLDDANLATKSYGAVNSRVFDALAAGALVLSNGCIGASETFEGKLPCFQSSGELHELIDYYLENEEARLEKVRELQELVFERHTYERRAKQLLNLLEHGS